MDPSIPGFTVLKELGRGGMGAVYLAQQDALMRLVALKVVLPAMANPDGYRRFRREAAALIRLSHPNVIRLFTYDLDHEPPWVAFEFVEHAVSLAEHIETTRPPFARQVEMMRDVASGLTCLHDEGLIHRDLKPANVLVSGNGVVKLIDMGLARPVAPGATKLTQDGAVLGTLAYMAPEQMLGDPVDARADVYSFGLMLYEVIAGRPVFSRRDGPMLLVRLTRGGIPELKPGHPDVSPDLVRLVWNCVERSPAARPSGGAELVTLLDLALRGGGRSTLAGARVEPEDESPSRPVSRPERSIALEADGSRTVALAAGPVQARRAAPVSRAPLSAVGAAVLVALALIAMSRLAPMRAPASSPASAAAPAAAYPIEQRAGKLDLLVKEQGLRSAAVQAELAGCLDDVAGDLERLAGQPVEARRYVDRTTHAIQNLLYQLCLTAPAESRLRDLESRLRSHERPDEAPLVGYVRSCMLVQLEARHLDPDPLEGVTRRYQLALTRLESAEPDWSRSEPGLLWRAWAATRVVELCLHREPELLAPDRVTRAWEDRIHGPAWELFSVFHRSSKLLPACASDRACNLLRTALIVSTLEVGELAGDFRAGKAHQRALSEGPAMVAEYRAFALGPYGVEPLEKAISGHTPPPVGR